MKPLSHIKWATLCFWFSLCMVGCGNRMPKAMQSYTDSLNSVSYAWRYKELTTSQAAAIDAWKAATHYPAGKAEACNNLGFCAYMQLNFEDAELWYRRAYEASSDKLERLVADIGLLKLYQRMARNQEFYEYRNKVLRQLNDLEEDASSWKSPRRIARFGYARSEFYITQAIYYYYLQQRVEARHSLNQVESTIELRTDTNQWLYYHYIKGATALCNNEFPDEQYLCEFDELLYTWLLSHRKGYTYFEGNALQGLANLMVAPEGYDFYLEERAYALQQLSYPVDTLLPLRLAEEALQLFHRYGDPYQMVAAYVSMAKYYNAHGHYQTALDTLQQALNCGDARVPESVSNVREQLSVTFAGLGNKEASDYNRNIYLDILDQTRQDKEIESRLHTLQQASSLLNFLLLTVVAVFIGVILFFILFNNRSKKRNRQHRQRLRKLIDICQQITSIHPTDVADSAELTSWVRSRLGKQDEAMIPLLQPYIAWAIENGIASENLLDEQARMEKQRYVHEQHIAENKRRNVVKKACVAIVMGIHPYIDRIIGEVNRLLHKDYLSKTDIKQQKFLYVDELISVINDYNEILARWIKLKQGDLNLHIETFSLAELFDLMAKSTRTFRQKQQTLEITPTDITVKADKALTLFMISTLMENARKYTPAGGVVRLYATHTDEYAEITVEDNGEGLSAEDVSRILGEKVYDSQTIGMHSTTDADELRRNKGYGFGLMNCKGIIEKYRKTNSLFQVCRFLIESRVGKGSRFSFRLPLGLRKVWMCVLLFTTTWLTGCRPASTSDITSHPQFDSLQAEAYEVLLDSASWYADEAYFSNVDGHFEQTLLYVDSAIQCLNAHYRRYADMPTRFMTLSGKGRAAELVWWESTYDTDFHIILDIRNEAAVAALALKRINDYHYNNTIYTTLYKLLGEDRSLEEHCLQLERSATYKLLNIWLGVLLLLSLPIGYYFLYYRKRRAEQRNLEMVLRVNRQVSEATRFTADELMEVPRHMADVIYHALHRPLKVEQIGVALYSNSEHRLQYASSPDILSPSQCQLMQQCYDARTPLRTSHSQTLPLLVESGEEQRCIGAILLTRSPRHEREADELLLELIVRHLSLVLFNAVVKLTAQYHDIELTQDEVRRASWEESQLHVQNQVLDNCLSAIKHETLYYPNRIKQLVDKLRAGHLDASEEKETLQSVSELISYYKGVFTLLSRCAMRQLQEVNFRRSAIPVEALLAYAEKYFRKRSKSSPVEVTLHTTSCSATVWGDLHLLHYLMENLIDEALSVPLAGIIQIDTALDEQFVRFSFTDRRRTKEVEELNQLFAPNLQQMSESHQDSLRGTGYLLCKQIIRDHDEYAGRRGCRINAKPASEGGFTVYFTCPIADKSQ
ncbi:MAG: DUF5112 domain-containing protein [Mediterranea massiliensis]|nr:DUF5112 domain-containing protein [Mediterranea massiliensis]